MTSDSEKPRMDEKRYKGFESRFAKAKDRESTIATLRDWFDAGGGPADTIANKFLFAMVLDANDDTLVDRALDTFDSWRDFETELVTAFVVGRGNEAVLKRPLDLGVSPKAGEGRMPYVAAAAINNSFECVDLLLARGASLEDRGALGYTALHWAASRGNERAVRFLLDRGADPDAVARNGKKTLTVLQVAKEKGHEGVIRLLLAREAASAEDGAGVQPVAENVIDPERIRAAVSEVRKTSTLDDAWFKERIPGEQLQAAIHSYAPGAAEETPLVLIPAIASGKAGFLLTDRAMYFRRALDSKDVRIRYGDIKTLTLDRRRLRIAGEYSSLEWDLTETLLWEESRRKVSELVVSILQKLLDKEAAPAPEGSTEAAAPGGRATWRCEGCKSDWRVKLWDWGEPDHPSGASWWEQSDAKDKIFREAMVGFGPHSVGIVTGKIPVLPAIVHVHAALMASWLMLFLLQGSLMARGRARVHEKMPLSLA